jgi:hypothetical protein
VGRVKARWRHLDVLSGAANIAEGGRTQWQRGWTRVAWRKKKGLMGGACVAVTGERKDVTTGVHELEGKAPFDKWAKRGGDGLRGKAGRCGRVGPAGLDPRRRFKQKLILEFQMNLDFGKTLRISTRRL